MHFRVIWILQNYKLLDNYAINILENWYFLIEYVRYQS